MRVYLDSNTKHVSEVAMIFPSEIRLLLNDKDTNVWQTDCSVPKNVHDLFFFQIKVTFKKMFRRTKIVVASFTDYSKSRYVFVGLNTNEKSIEIDALCDFFVDIIKNVAQLNLRTALLQMEAMANQQKTEIKATENSPHDHGIVFQVDNTLLNVTKKSLAQNVINKIGISAQNAIAICYFLSVIKAEKINCTKDWSAILNDRNALLIVDACKCIKKDEIPPNCIAPILTIVKRVCKLAYEKESSALFVIDVVYKLATRSFLTELIDECQDTSRHYPLYLPTDKFDCKTILLRMYKDHPDLVKPIVHNLDRKMIMQFLLLLYQNGIKNNETVYFIEFILDCRNIEAVERFGQSQGLQHVLAIWDSIAKPHFSRSEKFVKKCEKAILKSISNISNLKMNNLELLLKVLADDRLFLSQTLQCNLLENLSGLRISETANYFELLTQLLDIDKLSVSGDESYHLIEQWFRSGIQMKSGFKNENKGSIFISQTYLRLSKIRQTKYVKKHKDINEHLENSVLAVVKEFKFEAFAKVLHEDIQPDVRDIFVTHIRKLLQDRCFGNNANSIILDICEKDILNVAKR